MKYLKKNRKTTFLLLLHLIIVVNVYAQRGTNSGTHFFLAFGRNNEHSKIDSSYNPSLGKHVYNIELMLRMTAVEQSEVRFHFRNDSTLDKTITVNAGGLLDYKFSLPEMNAVYSTGQTTQSSKRDWRSLEITAVKPISVVAMSSASTSVEATLVFPVEVLGTEYFHAGMTPSGENQTNGYVIVAVEDGTTVTHNTPLSLVGTFTITLSKGEIYQYCYPTSINNNPSGTIITSNKPIAFFQNTTEAVISGRENYSFEQIPPVNQWGTKFILPTEYNVLNDQYAGFARVYAKNRNNDTIRGTVTYSNGTTSTFSIKPAGLSNAYYDIFMTSTSNPTAKACYITTDKPVGVCAYNTSRGSSIANDLPLPASAWLPPVEQRTRHVLISPLDFNGVHVYLPIWHYFTIITPTATKNNTTITFGGYTPQLVTMLGDTVFNWIADNVGGSGYSVGMGYFGKSNAAAQPPEFLRMIAVADNPAGVIALAYGQGSYTNYYYSVGSGIYNLLNNLEITAHPATVSVSKCQNTGDFPTLSVTASDASATYQWYKSTVNANSGGTAINGATSASYAPPSTQTGSFYYYCTAYRIFDSAVSNVSGLHVVSTCGVSGTVFPFVYNTDAGGNPDTAFNNLFPVTARLYALPAGNAHDPIKEIFKTQPLFEATAKYYDGSQWYDGIPKNPGTIATPNNAGIPIFWDELTDVSSLPPVQDTAVAAGELPQSPVGIYTFEDVPAGNYILVLSREGYITRFAEVTVGGQNSFLGHRELVLGDVNKKLQTENADASRIKAFLGAIRVLNYYPEHDMNADGIIDAEDLSLTKCLIGFGMVLYHDTRAWILKFLNY